MTPKKVLVVLAVLLVAAIYYYLYGDWFKKPVMAIHVTQRPRIGRRPPRPNETTPPENEMVVFTLGREYKLTGIEVFPSDALTNKFPLPVWQLVSDSNSVPTESFVYGGRIRGMHPKVKGLNAEPLKPSTGYRVVVQAGAVKGQHDFTTPAEDQPAQ